MCSSTKLIQVIAWSLAVHSNEYLGTDSDVRKFGMENFSAHQLGIKWFLFIICIAPGICTEFSITKGKVNCWSEQSKIVMRHKVMIKHRKTVQRRTRISLVSVHSDTQLTDYVFTQTHTEMHWLMCLWILLSSGGNHPRDDVSDSGRCEKT